jgi:hypothetical protein
MNRTKTALCVAMVAFCFGATASAQTGTITQPNPAQTIPPAGGVGAGGITPFSGTWSTTGLTNSGGSVQNRSTTTALSVIMTPGTYLVQSVGDGALAFVVSLWGSNDNGTTTCTQHYTNMDTGAGLVLSGSTTAQSKNNLVIGSLFQTGHWSSTIICTLPPWHGTTPHGIYGAFMPPSL